MAKKVSVVIPSFNGRDLLEKNLPSVIKNCQNCPLIIVDDGSSDDSVKFLKKRFKKTKVINLRHNQGFAQAANIGVRGAQTDLILLLNTDVVPRSNFLKPAINHFKDSRVFAVGLCDLSHENGKIIERGRGGGSFKKGLLIHFAATIERGETLWVSGGSGIFDRRKFLKLGGFDKIFAPFYWEDIDLSYRARKIGFHCLFEPLSKVDHFHQEGTIRKFHSSFYLALVSYKNQFIFVWKNISDLFLLLNHLFWLPYHLIRAVILLDLAFLLGLIYALLALPGLIFISEPLPKSLYSDREVLKDFGKS